MPYLPLCFTTPIMTQAHAPIHSLQKLIESNIEVRYTFIAFIMHVPNHTSPNDLNQIFVLFLSKNILLSHVNKIPRLLLFFHTFTNASMIKKTSLLRHLFYYVHIKPIKTLPYLIQTLLIICSLMSTIHTHNIQHT